MPKKKEQAVYQITVTERQLKLINAALEEFFRLGLNQWWGLHKFPFRKLSWVSPYQPFAARVGG